MFKITTDTSCDVFKNELKEKNISYISLIYTINEEDFEDHFSSDEEYENFYNEIAKGVMPTTSQINAYRHYKFFKHILKKDPNTPILHLSLSSGLSATYERALEGARLAKEKYPDAKIYVLDTLSATQGHNLVLKKAIELNENNIEIEEAYNILLEHRLKCHHWIFIEDLMHLKRGGRVSAGAALIGTAFQIKPLAIVDENGKIEVVQKIRGTIKGVSALIEKIEKYALDKENLDMVIANAGNTPLCEKIKEEVLKKYPNAKIEIGWIGPVVGAHTGKGTVGIGFVGVPRNQIK